jgi:hypothetical protein
MTPIIYTKAYEVSDEIARRMRTITLANGCETDIGRDVMLGKRKLPGDDRPPCLTVVEGNDDPRDQSNRQAQVTISQTYVFDGFDVCDPDNPNTKAHAMIRDIKRALFKDGGTFGRAVRSVTYLGRDIGPRPDGAALVQARVTISVEFVEDLANP